MKDELVEIRLPHVALSGCEDIYQQVIASRILYHMSHQIAVEGQWLCGPEIIREDAHSGGKFDDGDE